MHMKRMTHPASLTPPLLAYNPPSEPYLNVLFEDSHIAVIEKPAGLLSVPGKAEEHWDCLDYRARQRFGDTRIVHRLDMDTSGLMVLARDAISLKGLGRQFEKRKVEKHYIARVWGHVDQEQGCIDLPLICDWPNRPKQMVCFERGKAARTDWLVLDRDAVSTLVRLTPHTGRSHQLRVHMLSIGHVILGDRFYAEGEALTSVDRLMLHAERLSFIHPVKGEWVEFESPRPFP
ncbi:RluA family pseudouridine synthase [uncultured Cohaesibacter sp.]|uniref:RluA family pseudouridine synthase n=1 Tax=uncultured Cohaesibacter sp. TaxID=1002546 RepID=UPI002ABE4681|nr:RluA family pseudouridine synthase [uncultured Cohaesibacter sp.]